MMNIKEEDYIVNQPFDVESLDYEKAKLTISGITEVAFAQKMCFFVFDYFKHNYLFIKSFNEYFNDIPENIEEPYLFFNLKVHPEDRILIKQIHHRAFSFIFSQKLEKRKNAILRYSCRFQNKNKKYPMTDITLKMMETDRNGAVWLVLFLVEKSTSYFYSIPQIEIDNEETPYVFELNKGHLEKFTDQETLIAHKLFENVSHQEIAKQINRRVSTIRSHIYKLYIKTNAKNRLDFQKNMLLY